VVGTLAEYFDWVPVCPEVEAGMGTPRPTIRQVDDEGTLRIVTRQGEDFTEALVDASRRRIAALEGKNLSGFILKSGSPSCGMERVKVYRKTTPEKKGVGVFAALLRLRWPNLPMEEEGRLNDALLRENFIQRVYTYQRLRTFARSNPTHGGLMALHGSLKFLLMAHSQSASQRLGRLLAQGRSVPIQDLLSEYEHGVMMAIAKPAKVGGHVNTLQRIGGFLKHELSRSNKEHINEIIEAYREGLVPLITPLTLLKHHLRNTDMGWLTGQVYLAPYPAKLALRSRI
jgi:uncharacterized protein YbgA (DUF1722 family)/uncharacterized protein YbbK (DUF523 family)